MAGGQRSKLGKLVAASELIAIGDVPIPMTFVIRSTAVGRGFGLSFDEGVEVFPITTIDQTSTTEIVLHLTVPCTHVRFTGNIGDAWRIIWSQTDV